MTEEGEGGEPSQINQFKLFILYNYKRKMEKSRRCDICNIGLHRASYAKHLGSENQLEHIKHEGMNITERLFQEPNVNTSRKRCKFRPLEQLTRKVNEKLDKELAKKMINPYYFTAIALKVRFCITSNSHLNNGANSKLPNKPNYSENDIRYVDKIFKEMATFYAKLINQFKNKYQTVFSARFDKQKEEGQMLDEIEIYNNIGIIRK